MKFLCLAYADEQAWRGLPADDQHRLLAQDDALRHRGDYIAAVDQEVTTVTAWGGAVSANESSFAKLRVPLVGFSIIDAENLEEAVRLVAGSTSAQSGGAVEVRRIDESSAPLPPLEEDALEPPEFASGSEWCSGR